MNCPVITRTAIVRNPNGLHLRPAGVLSKMAGEFTAQVQICKDGLCVDAASILDLITLVASHGSELKIQATGDDAQAAVDAVAEFIESDVADDDHSA